MKKILITGANSYVGTNVEKWLMKEPDKYYVETLDMKDPNWKEFDFSKFDVVFHVAGIAHVSPKKSMSEIYFRINRDLAIETAIKSKKSRIKHFILMSSMIVYNSKETKINENTKPNPDNAYGLSKIEAEKGIEKLADVNFKISILRPPMIYGKESKGNFSKLIKFTKKFFLFPNYNNSRSILYIDNLSIYIKEIIEKAATGLLFPKNKEYVSTKLIIETVAIHLGKKIYFIKIFNPFIDLIKGKLRVINRVFGDSYYDFNSISDFDKSLDLINFSETISKTLK